jgi:hypothetical protein
MHRIDLRYWIEERSRHRFLKGLSTIDAANVITKPEAKRLPINAFER